MKIVRKIFRSSWWGNGGTLLLKINLLFLWGYNGLLSWLQKLLKITEKEVGGGQLHLALKIRIGKIKYKAKGSKAI